MLPELPVKLADVYVHSVDAQCTALQQAVGEAAGRGAQIEANTTRGIEGEILERAGELESTAAREFLRTGRDSNARIRGDCCPSLVCARPIHLNFASED